MRIFVKGLIVVGLMCVSVILAVVSLLSNFTGEMAESGEISLDMLTVGNAHHLLVTEIFWRHYPAVPFSIETLLDWPALFLMAGVIAFGVCVLRKRLGQSWLVVSALPLLVAMVVYGVGLVSLEGNTVAAECGSWLATMWMSLLYAGVAGCVFWGVWLKTSELKSTTPLG